MNETKESFYYIDEIKGEYKQPETSAGNTLNVAEKPHGERYSYCVLGALILDNKYFLEAATDVDDELSQLIRQAEGNIYDTRYFPDEAEARDALLHLFDFPDNNDAFDEAEYITFNVIQLNDAGEFENAWKFLKEKLSEYSYLGIRNKVWMSEDEIDSLDFPVSE